jgi:acetyltransferase-like isoleucine patch superfamily enzyme
MGNEMIRTLLYNLYGIKNNRVRGFILSLIRRMEKGELYSKTLRKIFKNYHEIEIGLYSHGGCFHPANISPHTTFGRYCSIANSVHIFNRDHPINFKSTHGFFFNPRFKMVKKDTHEYIPLRIGNDVWIGYNAIILPLVKEIGNGAIIGAGAVVNKDIPPYAIVVGNPARIVRYRFSPQTINSLLESRWWDNDIEQLMGQMDEFLRPFEHEKIETEMNPEYSNNR